MDHYFSLGFWKLNFNVKLKLLDGVCYYRIQLDTEDRLFEDTREYEEIMEAYQEKEMFSVCLVNKDLITIHQIDLLRKNIIRTLNYNEEAINVNFNGNFLCSQEKFNEFMKLNVTTRMSI